MNLLKSGWAGLKSYEDTLRLLLKGDFAGLSPREREAVSEQIIQASAMAAMALGAAPVPLLETPVLAAMVHALGRVHGQEVTGKKALLEIGAAVGGGLLIRQALRLVPFVGGLAHASRVYGATWAVGRAAQLYFSRGAETSPEEMRRVFRETMDAKAREQEARMDDPTLEEKLRTLERLREENLIGDEEYREKRAELLASL